MIRAGLSVLLVALMLSASVTAQRVTPRSIPATAQASVFQRGMASFYFGRNDRTTVFVAAHRTLPFGTWVRVTHQQTGRSVVVKLMTGGRSCLGASLMFQMRRRRCWE